MASLVVMNFIYEKALELEVHWKAVPACGKSLKFSEIPGLEM